jgi:carbamoyl-phosphate synthase large subunit
MLLLLPLLLASTGKVFISMADKYKADAVGIAKQLTDMGYQVVATRGTASTLMSAGARGTAVTRYSYCCSKFRLSLVFHP